MTPDPAPALVTADDLSVHTADHCLVSSVSFRLRPGERLGIVGETGSGKSVTCRALVGGLARKGLRAEGALTFDGHDLLRTGPADWRELRRGSIGFVPQSSLSSLDPVMRVDRQLAETVRALGVARRDAADRVAELLDLVRLPDPAKVGKSYPHQLSGGMRQRVVIALGIAGNPRLLVADEPTTALDVSVQRGILQLLTSLCATRGMALVLVTHDLGVVADVCDSVLVMYAGEQVETGPVGPVFDAPLHPYSDALLRARPSGQAKAERLLGLPGQPPHPAEWPDGCRFAPRCDRAADACRAAPPAPRGHGDRVARCIDPVVTR